MFLQCRPTPTYIWKARRRKFQKRKHLTKKRIEILELASDLDTDDDCRDEQIEKALEKFNPKGSNAHAKEANKVKWLKQTLYPLRHRKCSSDECSDSPASDSEEACKNIPSVSNEKNVPANCSSEEDTCDVDRDSDYEYFHVWGESDSGHSDLNVAEDIDLTAGSHFLVKNVPTKNKVPRRKQITYDYDAPSPEPYLPDANETCEPSPCVHKLPVYDSLAMSMLNLGISKPSADMPRFHLIPSFNVVEKPFEFVTEEESPQLGVATSVKTSSVCKRKMPDMLDAKECTPRKVAKNVDMSISPASPPSPLSTCDSIPSFSPPNSDDEATLSRVKSKHVKQNPTRNILVQSRNYSDSPFHTPNSDMGIRSPPMVPRCTYP